MRLALAVVWPSQRWEATNCLGNQQQGYHSSNRNIIFLLRRTKKNSTSSRLQPGICCRVIVGAQDSTGYPWRVAHRYHQPLPGLEAASAALLQGFQVVTGQQLIKDAHGRLQDNGSSQLSCEPLIALICKAGKGSFRVTPRSS